MTQHAKSSVVMGFYFFPRGGSAQVARYLCRALDRTRWAPTLFAGSIGDLDNVANAHRFFSGIRCESLDYSAANADWERGADPMSASVPIHASFEDKPAVPDRCFFELDDRAFDRQVASWSRFFGAHRSIDPSVVHLHHLTPMHEAVATVWPGVPIVTHLHGTELKMLDDVDGATEPAGARRWTDEWVQRMRRWAASSAQLIVISAHDEALAQRLLPIDAAAITTIANGVDTAAFAPRPRTHSDRLAGWRRWLVDDPRGWRPGHPEGSVRYCGDDLAAFTDRDGEPVPVVLFAGRFLHFKRLQVLIEAHHSRRETSTVPSVLVVVGGFPGEWEGEHPYDTVQRLGARDVFFVGWRDHDDLAEILNCSDVFAATSVDEPFGLVYLEAMATGVPPIATSTGGPLSFINLDPDHPTGWLVPPDDAASTVGALTVAVTDRSARLDRGRRAASFVRERYSWASSATTIARLYEQLTDERRAQPEPPASGVA